jgi:hypothetical protein
MLRKLIGPILLALLFNTAIAGQLTLVGFGPGFWINLVFAQCIGMSIFATLISGSALPKQEHLNRKVQQ